MSGYIYVQTCASVPNKGQVGRYFRALRVENLNFFFPNVSNMVFVSTCWKLSCLRALKEGDSDEFHRKLKDTKQVMLSCFCVCLRMLYLLTYVLYTC